MVNYLTPVMLTLHETDKHTKMVNYLTPVMLTLHETDNQVGWCGIVDKLDVWTILHETY